MQVLPVTIVVFLVINFGAAWYVNDTTLQERHASLEHIAAQSSTTIAIRLQSIVDTAETLALNDLVINSLVDLSERDRYIPMLFQSIRIPGMDGAHVTLADYRGRSIAANVSSGSYTSAPWLADVMTGKNLTEIRASGLIVAVPVMIANFPEGLIIVEFDSGELAKILELPIRADAYSINISAGKVIASSNEAFAPLGALNQFQKVDTDWLRATSSVRGFPNLQLHVGDTKATALATVQQQEFFLLLSILLSMLTVTIGIAVTAMKVSNPLAGFVSGVKRVGNSADLTYRMEASGPDEFRQLTTSFNDMLSKLELTTSSRDYVDGILNCINEYLFVLSDNGVVQSGNRAVAQFLECDKQELAGRNINSFLNTNLAELVKRADGDHNPLECRLTNHNMRSLPVMVSISRLHLADNADANLIIVLNDITEQTLARFTVDKQVKDLERSNSDLEQFAYVASHDLKAPLRAIDNLAGWIEEDVAEQLSDDGRNYLDLLRSRIKRLDMLLDGLLRYAQTGRDETDLEIVDSCSLVTDIVELIQPPASMKVAISETLPEFLTHRPPLQQILHNLIGNALKHHDRTEGVVEISCRDMDDQYEFLVADDGPGISDEYHAKIFQMFQTLKRRDETESSGIGLALVQKLVRNNGGTISVSSSASERGAAFRFTWPKHNILEDRKHAA